MKSARSIALATVFILALQPDADAVQQKDRQEQDRGQAQGRSRGGGPPNAEVEAQLRKAVTSAMKNRLQLSDSMVSRLASVTFRYRDSTLRLLDQERFVRGELRFEDRPDSNRVPNETRISCLLGAFFDIQQKRFNLRIAEDKEITAFLSPSKRLRYLAIQENLHEAIDNAFDNQNQGMRDGRGGGGRRDGGPPRQGGAGRGIGGGPPPGGRPMGPGGRGGVPICPPGPRR